MKEFSEIWIINEDGKPLFNKSIDSKVDPALFGGFLSAIQKFVQTSFHGSKIEKLLLGESKICFLYAEKYNIYIVIRCHKKVKDENIQRNLELIRNLFISEFKDKLNKDVSNISEFQSFNKILEEKFEESHIIRRMKNWFAEL
ncbi:MAG: hypothetical protein ACTSYB_11155 [Candidatus Helarchaeota archaeon]